MNYRSSEILAAESIATAGTKTIDINLADVISRITIGIKATGSTNTATAHPAKILKKIEVVDGSNVVFSMKGIATQALDWFDTFIEPHCSLVYLNGVMAMLYVSLNFGRYLYDPDLALDPKRFSNLQLKIQHDLLLGGALPSACDLRVRADVFDEKVPSPRGYLCSKEHYTFPDANSAVEYIDLPTDFVLRKLMIQANADDRYPYQQVSQVKLSEEHDKKVVLEGYVSDFLKLIPDNAKLHKEMVYGSTGAVKTYAFVTPTYLSTMVACATDDMSGYVFPARDAGQKQGLAASGTVNYEAVVQGWCPNGAFVVPFGDQMDPADWYDVTRLKSCRLKITQGSSVSGAETIEVLTQQLRTY